jgi:type I restriction enzyme S subunit
MRWMITGGCCRTYVDASVPRPAYINQHIALVRLDAKRACAKFVAYFLASEMPQREFQSITDVGAKAGLSLITVRKVTTALPPVREQRAIADALGDVDALLEALDRQIVKQRDLKQAAMQQLLTGRIRLPGFTGEWSMVRLGDHLTFLKHGTNSRAELMATGTVKYLHYGDIHGSAGVMLNPSTTRMPYLQESKARALDRLQDGDLVFADASEDLEGVGRSVELCGIGSSEVVSGMHTIAIRFDNAMLANGFKGYLQFLPTFRGHLQRLAAGTKVYATNRAYIASEEIALPSVAEQTAIAAVLSDMDAEIAALEARRVKTRDLKQAMMQELLTGKTRLV